MSQVSNKELRKPGLFLSGCLGVICLLVMGFFGLVAVGTFFEKDYPLGASLLLLFVAGVAGFLGHWAYRVQRKRRMAGKYIEIIANQNHASVKNIAMLLGRSDEDAVMTEIQLVITAGFLPGYALNPKLKMVDRVDPAAPPIIGKIHRVSFVCASCGAQNRVEAAEYERVRCEFCGTPHVE